MSCRFGWGNDALYGHWTVMRQTRCYPFSVESWQRLGVVLRVMVGKQKLKESFISILH